MQNKLFMLLFVAILGVISIQVLLAQAEKVKEFQIDEVVVEAVKTLSPSNSNVIATIEQKDIQFASVTNLQELLEYLQSVDIRTRGPEGVQADVNIRGGTFDQTVVLLNGINFTDPQTGHFSLNIPIDVSAIERIEVLQGIDTWIAGIPAFCGAINIITKSATTNTITPHFNYGMNNFYRAGASITGKSTSSKITGVANFNYSQSDGYAVNTDFYNINAFLLLKYSDEQIGNFDFQTGYLEKEFGANSFYSITYREQFEMNKAFISSLKYNNIFDCFGENQKIDVNSSIYYRLHKDRFELFRSKPLPSKWEHIPSEWEEIPQWYAGHNFHHTDIYGLNASVNYNWNLGVTTLGTDFRSEKIKSSNLGELLDNPISVPNVENAFYNRSKLRLHEDVYFKHYFSANRWDLHFGTMASGNNEFGFRAISGGNFRFLLTPLSNILFTVHQGYRLPTFTDLYYSDPSQVGNPDLKPEESINTEIAYMWNNSKLFLQSNIFYRYGYRIIDWVRSFDEPIWRSENLTNVATLGYDISAEYNFTNSFINMVRLNYSYLDVKSNSPDGHISVYEANFLRHKLNLGILHKIWNSKDEKNTIVANWLFRFQSRAGFYLDSDRNIINYPAFLLCDLKIIWQSKYFNFFVEGTNLFDKQYVDIGNLPQPGIWLKAGTEFKINILSQ
ncbi:MAG: TonB-dependent receptor [Bacteroidetes bacterium]|nr:TonB-dependent receptor [Bacteroidota bacterium]